MFIVGNSKLWFFSILLFLIISFIYQILTEGTIFIVGNVHDYLKFFSAAHAYLSNVELFTDYKSPLGWVHFALNGWGILIINSFNLNLNVLFYIDSFLVLLMFVCIILLFNFFVIKFKYRTPLWLIVFCVAIVFSYKPIMTSNFRDLAFYGLYNNYILIFIVFQIYISWIFFFSYHNKIEILKNKYSLYYLILIQLFIILYALFYKYTHGIIALLLGISIVFTLSRKNAFVYFSLGVISLLFSVLLISHYLDVLSYAETIYFSLIGKTEARKISFSSITSFIVFSFLMLVRNNKIDDFRWVGFFLSLAAAQFLILYSDGLLKEHFFIPIIVIMLIVNYDFSNNSVLKLSHSLLLKKLSLLYVLWLSLLVAISSFVLLKFRITSLYSYNIEQRLLYQDLIPFFNYRKEIFYLRFQRINLESSYFNKSIDLLFFSDRKVFLMHHLFINREDSVVLSEKELKILNNFKTAIFDGTDFRNTDYIFNLQHLKIILTNNFPNIHNLNLFFNEFINPLPWILDAKIPLYSYHWLDYNTTIPVKELNLLYKGLNNSDIIALPVRNLGYPQAFANCVVFDYVFKNDQLFDLVYSDDFDIIFAKKGVTHNFNLNKDNQSRIRTVMEDLREEYCLKDLKVFN